MATKHDVDAALFLHTGKASGIKADDLARQLGCDVRLVRHLVTQLRLEGRAICGHPKTGYFIAQTNEELEETCAFLRTRALHSLTLESKLRHVPLVELLGQMRLKT